MRKTRHGSSGVVVALMVGWVAPLVPSLTHAAPVAEPDRRGMSFDELIARAEQERAQTKYEDSGRSYVAAYHSLSLEDRVGLKGEIAVENALASYRLAYKVRPELVFLEQPVLLLEEFAEVRGQAHLAGRAKAVPLRLRAELARATKRLGDARAIMVTEPAETSAEPTVAGEVPPSPVSSPSSANSASPANSPEERRKLGEDIAILATGVASLTTGFVLLGRGAWLSDEINRMVDRRVDALLYRDLSASTVEEYWTYLQSWKQTSRGVARKLMVAGSLLAVAGGSLSLWGGLRLARRIRGSKRQVRVALPVVWRGQVDVAVSLAF